MLFSTREAGLERWLSNTVTILDRFYCSHDTIPFMMDTLETKHITECSKRRHFTEWVLPLHMQAEIAWAISCAASGDPLQSLPLLAPPWKQEHHFPLSHYPLQQILPCSLVLEPPALPAWRTVGKQGHMSMSMTRLQCRKLHKETTFSELETVALWLHTLQHRLPHTAPVAPSAWHWMKSTRQPSVESIPTIADLENRSKTKIIPVVGKSPAVIQYGAQTKK